MKAIFYYLICPLFWLTVVAISLLVGVAVIKWAIEMVFG